MPRGDVKEEFKFQINYVKLLIQEAFNELSSEKWFKCCAHVLVFSINFTEANIGRSTLLLRIKSGKLPSMLTEVTAALKRRTNWSMTRAQRTTNSTQLACMTVTQRLTCGRMKTR